MHINYRDLSPAELRPAVAPATLRGNADPGRSRADIDSRINRLVSLPTPAGRVILLSSIADQAKTDLPAAEHEACFTHLEGVAANLLSSSAQQHVKSIIGAYRADASTQRRLGSAYLSTRHLRQIGYTLCKTAAMQRDPEAIYLVARALVVGLGVSRNPELGRSLLAQAAHAGDLRARTSLGRLKLSGEGGPRDPQAAVNDFWIAAHADHHDASLELARLYARGTIVPLDTEMALTLYNRAAAAGHIPSRIELGTELTLGVRFPYDAIGALHWLAPLAQEGNVKASDALARLVERSIGDDPMQLDLQQGGSL